MQAVLMVDVGEGYVE